MKRFSSPCIRSCHHFWQLNVHEKRCEGLRTVGFTISRLSSSLLESSACTKISLSKLWSSNELLYFSMFPHQDVVEQRIVFILDLLLHWDDVAIFGPDL